MTTTAQETNPNDVQCGICGTIIPHVTYDNERGGEFGCKDYDKIHYVHGTTNKKVCIPCKQGFGDQRFNHNQSLLRAEVEAWEFAFSPLKSSGDVEAWVYELQALNFNWHPDDGFSTQVWHNQNGHRCLDKAFQPHLSNGGGKTILINDGRVNGEYIPQGQRDALDKRLDEAYELVSEDELYTFIFEAEEKHKLDNMMGYIN